VEVMFVMVFLELLPEGQDGGYDGLMEETVGISGLYKTIGNRRKLSVCGEYLCTFVYIYINNT
jgi:hypothetical protein